MEIKGAVGRGLEKMHHLARAGKKRKSLLMSCFLCLLMVIPAGKTCIGIGEKNLILKDAGRKEARRLTRPTGNKKPSTMRGGKQK